MSEFLNDFEVTEINKNITTASDYHRTLYTHGAFSFLIHKYRHASGKSQLPNGAFKLFAIVFMTRSNCCSSRNAFKYRHCNEPRQATHATYRLSAEPLEPKASGASRRLGSGCHTIHSYGDTQVKAGA
jgi:hypothetical protein